MKKFFFFRSSASSNESNNEVPPPSKDKQGYWENPVDGATKSEATDKSRAKKQVSEKHNSGTSPCLRRSLSYSSATAYEGQRNPSCSNNQIGSPCSSTNVSHRRSGSHSSRLRTLTPERQPKAKWSEAAENGDVGKTPGCVASFRDQYDSSENSSNSSSNVSSKVVDRFIDGEQRLERIAPKNKSSFRSHAGNGKGNGGGKRPPRVQYTAPASPMNDMKQKSRSYSFRESKGSQPYFSTRDWVENGLEHDSPRKLAKHVVERLSQSRGIPRASSKEFDPDAPITVEDIYGGPLNRTSSLDSDELSHRNRPFHWPDETTSEDQHKEIPVLNSAETEEDTDLELNRKCKEAEERAVFLSEELSQDSFLQDGAFSVSGLIQTIRNLTEEKINMAVEVSTVLQHRIAERYSAREELRLAKAELDSRTRRLEREKDELQSSLEKELDRRSNEWSFKLEKYQTEEQRLRERVRELAEQNVSLQRDVSSISEREMDIRNKITYSEKLLKDLNARVEEARDENQNLQQNLSELQESYRAAKEDRDCLRRNYEEKEKECKELHRSITRLQRTCSEQEKTVDGLREGLSEEVRKKTSPGNFDNQLGKLQMEQLRLTGVEQALRKEVETYRHEVDSLRHENINLLHRLKGSGKEGRSTFKLDQELWDRVCCLQNQGLSFLNESTHLSFKLLEYIKAKVSRTSETKQGIEVTKNGLDGQFVVESDVKLQSLKRGSENLTRSLRNISVVLQEKSYLESPSHSLGDGSGQLNDQSSEDIIRSEFKAETLLTSLLREKLYSKELDLEQLQAELAAAVRGNDILRCEVQNAMDSLSCVTHKMKDLEIQMIKKDENINRLQNDLQECTKDLSIMRGILPKVSEERDYMWEEVKQYSEKTMLLNSEVDVLKKRIEALDEDILLKEGQITILKDTLAKPFDLLASPDSTREFMLV